ncbi:MAG: hypothetical protein HY554_04250 [Elusimicrobia bacterium]|nr:hypothetical protein [Elusimicrobiota bacterium]
MHQAAKEVSVGIEYPKKGETIVSPQYSLRINAPLDAQKVELAVDGGSYLHCRRDSGFWWFDWTGYGAGYHAAVVKVTLRDGFVAILPPHELEVDLAGEPARPEGQPTLTQFSVITQNKPEMLTKVTQILKREGVELNGAVTERFGDSVAFRFLTSRESGLRETLENAGLPVLQSQVFQLELSTEAADLNRLARLLADEGINVVSLYSTAQGQRARYVLAVDQPEAAAQVIERSGVALV